MTRAEHLEWAKERACKKNEITDILASFVSDMDKHDELKGHPALALMTNLILVGWIKTTSQLKDFVNDFN